MTRLQYLTFLVAVVFIPPLFGSHVLGAVVTSYSTPGATAANSSRNIGQSVTTPAGGSFSELTFNFFEAGFLAGGAFSEEAPFAEGELFLLTQEYLGTADDLSISTPGFLASTTALQPEGAGLEWVFDSGVTLQPATQYYLYAKNPGASFGTLKALSSSSSTLYAGGVYYQTQNGGSSTPYFPSNSNDWHFELEGVTAVPEPSAFVLITIVGSLAATIRRLRILGSSSA